MHWWEDFVNDERPTGKETTCEWNDGGKIGKIILRHVIVVSISYLRFSYTNDFRIFKYSPKIIKLRIKFTRHIQRRNESI